MKKTINLIPILVITALLPLSGYAQWGLSGNSISSTQFLGTTNNQPFLIKRNNTTIFNSDVYDNFTLGSSNLATGYGISNSYFIGNTVGASDYALSCMGLGHSISFNGAGDDVTDGYAFGKFLEINNYGGFCIGKGISVSSPLSVGGEGIFIGYKSTLATLFVGSSNGVNTTGNVGVATTTPAYKLDVNGTFRTTDNSYLMGNVGVGTTAPAYKLDVSGILRTTDNSYLMGNVGVGTTAPAYKLDVNGIFRTTDNSYLMGNVGVGTTAPAYKLDVNGIFRTTDNSYLMGNVGVGTTTPAAKLDVNGDAIIGKTGARHFLTIASSQYPEIRFRTPTDNNVIRLGVSHENNTDYGVNNGDLYAYSETANRMDLIVKKTGGVALAVKGGSVGIGTYTPENAEGWDKVLDVRGLNHAKMIATTTNGNVQTGIWAHVSGAYPGTLAGGITGTSSNHAFSIMTNSIGRLTVNTQGNIGIGTTCVPTGFKLAVKGKIICEEVEVKLENNNCWADYVFDSTYNLMNLADLEHFVSKNKHLPNVPSSSELVEKGMNVNEMLKIHMEKIEELTMYMIQLKKENEELRKLIRN